MGTNHKTNQSLTWTWLVCENLTPTMHPRTSMSFNLMALEGFGNWKFDSRGLTWQSLKAVLLQLRWIKWSIFFCKCSICYLFPPFYLPWALRLILNTWLVLTCWVNYQIKDRRQSVPKAGRFRKPKTSLSRERKAADNFIPPDPADFSLEHFSTWEKKAQQKR